MLSAVTLLTRAEMFVMVPPVHAPVASFHVVEQASILTVVVLEEPVMVSNIVKLAVVTVPTFLREKYVPVAAEVDRATAAIV